MLVRTVQLLVLLCFLLCVYSKKKDRYCVELKKHDFKNDYDYILGTGGFYFKFHDNPTNWDDARRLCRLEGAQLASPLTDELLTTMVHFLSKLNRTKTSLHTGFNSKHLAGRYLSLNGELLEDIAHLWADGDPSRYRQLHNTIALNAEGKVHIVNFHQHFPFVCMKKHVRNLTRNMCGTSDKGYNIERHKNGRCFKFHHLAMNWEQAAATCFGEGGYLSIIREESDAIMLRRDILTINNTAKIKGATAKTHFHSGFFRNHTIGDWRTVFFESLDEVGYTTGNLTEDPLKLCGSYNMTAKLINLHCNESLAFVCEMEFTSD